jgi:transposase InsO family protein
LGNPRNGAENPSYYPSKRIASVDAMALHGLRGPNKRKYVATTNSNHGLPVAPNLLARNFTAVDG